MSSFVEPHDLFEVVSKQIAPFPKLLVALSGGVDSIALLHILSQLRSTQHMPITLRAIYIHHGLSPFANDWLQHCQKQCSAWQIPFLVDHVTIDRSQGNIEAQARQARYSAFKKWIEPDETLCTAQHLDDQCETFFLALKRGSGVAGLSAMPIYHEEQGYGLLRPLLSIQKAQLIHYAKQHQLQWIEDESNGETQYDRNFLRHHILPELNQRWPQFSQMVARSVQHCQTQETLLNTLLQQEYATLIDHQQALSIPELCDKTEAHRYALLRLWLKDHAVPRLSQSQMSTLWQTVALARQDSQPKLVIDTYQIRRYQQRLYCLPIYADLSDLSFVWNGKSPLRLPDHLGYLSASTQQPQCRSPQSHEQITVRFSAQETITRSTTHYAIVGRAQARSLKKLWQERHVAPWLRNRIPLIYYNDQLIAAVGHFVTQEGDGDDVRYHIEHTVP